MIKSVWALKRPKSSGAVALAAPLAQSTRILSPARSDSTVEATKSI